MLENWTVMALHQISEEYLRSVSPLARRISEDLVAAREAYQDLWDTLDSNEKKQVLDEALIDPAVVLKYTTGNEASWSVEPLSQFSWFTKSQLNLCAHLKQQQQQDKQPRTPIKKPIDVVSPARRTVAADGGSETNSKQPAPVPVSQESTNIFGKLKNKVRKSSSGPEEKQCLVECRPHVSIMPPKTVVAKPKTPPPPPPTHLHVPTECKSLLAHQSSDHTDDIPKTGFDFLDNW